MKEWIRESILTDSELIEKSLGRAIVCFGAGAGGKAFFLDHFMEINIVCFIDNVMGNGTIYSVPVHLYKEYKERLKDKLIVITTEKYCEQVAEQLKQDGFLPHKDFVIYNPMGEKEDPERMASNISRLVEFNQKHWKKADNHYKNKIIIPYYDTIELMHVTWAYASNFLADKHEAEIWGVDLGRFNHTFAKTEHDEYTDAIYSSFNTKGVIAIELTKEQEEEASVIYREIVESKKTRHEYNEIIVYGEDFGEDIISDYLRLEYPIIDINDTTFCTTVYQLIRQIVFWHYYFKNNNAVKAVVLWDGIYREGILRKIAIGHGIPVYSIVTTACFRWENTMQFNYRYFKKFFYSLSEAEQQKGLDFAKRKLEERFQGSVKDFATSKQSPYTVVIQERVLDKSDKVKVMILPQYFGDDAYPYGDMLFDDPWDWLCYLGEITEKTDYEWYLKVHPIERKLGKGLIQKYLQKYPKIKLLPDKISPIQLKNEGMQFALTIHGSIGFEYPAIGIQVINAGNNPYIAFDFDWNPKSREQYEEWLLHLEDLHKEIDMTEIYQYYCVDFLYYQGRRFFTRNLFFKNPLLQTVRDLVGAPIKSSTELYRMFVEECTDERHEELKKIFELLFEEMDEYRNGVFYRKENSLLYPYYN